MGTIRKILKFEIAHERIICWEFVTKEDNENLPYNKIIEKYGMTLDEYTKLLLDTRDITTSAGISIVLTKNQLVELNDLLYYELHSGSKQISLRNIRLGDIHQMTKDLVKKILEKKYE